MTILTPVMPAGLAADGTRYRITSVWEGTLTEVTPAAPDDPDRVDFVLRTDDGKTMRGHTGGGGAVSMTFERFDIPVPTALGAVVRAEIDPREVEGRVVVVVLELRDAGGVGWRWYDTSGHAWKSGDIARVVQVLYRGDVS